MINLPSSPVAIDIGMRLHRIIDEIEAWSTTYKDVVNIAWDVCEMNDWPMLEMTYPMPWGWGTISPPDKDHDEYGALLQVAGAARMLIAVETTKKLSSKPGVHRSTYNALVEAVQNLTKVQTNLIED